jgi:excisionase family DNA binding protein
MMTHDPPLLTQAETARRLGVSRWTVGRMLRSGQLRGVQVSRRTRVPATEIERVREGRSS